MGNAFANCIYEAGGNHPSRPQQREGGKHGANINRITRRQQSRGPRTLRGTLSLQIHRKNVNPFKYYDVLDLIGEGSISTIWKVRRKSRDDVCGGWRRGRRGRGRGGVGRVLFFWKFFGSKKDKRRLSHDGCGEDDDGRGDGAGDYGGGVGGSAVIDAVSLHDALRRSSEQVYALKAIQTDQVSEIFMDEMRNEVRILKNLDHPNIVKVYELFDYRRKLYIVMEHLSGGDLYARAPYSERDAARIVAKLLSAVEYMHRRNVVHRDLKFENIMFENSSPDAEIKVIDFGLSKKYVGGHFTMTEKVGTVYTMAPQVLQGIYTSQADLWSVGVITYMLLSGKKPFWGKKRKHIIDKIMRCAYNFDGVVWLTISEDAKNFVASLLRMDPWRRPTARAALRSPWLRRTTFLKGDGGGHGSAPDDEVVQQIQDNLAAYAEETRFKKISLMIVAHKSSMEDIVKLREMFDRYDLNHDGTISYREFKEALSECNYSHEDLQTMFASLDVGKSGVIDYTEFLAATLETQGRIESSRLAEAFDRFDTDGTGYISEQNLWDILGSKRSSLIKEILEEVDTDRDGSISYEEFLEIFRSKRESELETAYSDLCTESVSSDESELLNEDAVIPGGKHDPEAGNSSRDSKKWWWWSP